MLWELIKRLVKCKKFVEVLFVRKVFVEVLLVGIVFFCSYTLQDSKNNLFYTDVLLGFYAHSNTYCYSTFDSSYIFYY